MKGFSDSERDRIREGLLEAGREQFSAFGHDRTRISDLTDAVDIATSTFYQFFDSKEALYLEILNREQNRMAEELEAILGAAPDLRSEVLAGFEYFFEELETNPLYYRLIAEDDIRPLHTEASERGWKRTTRRSSECSNPTPSGGRTTTPSGSTIPRSWSACSGCSPLRSSPRRRSRGSAPRSSTTPTGRSSRRWSTGCCSGRRAVARVERLAPLGVTESQGESLAL